VATIYDELGQALIDVLTLLEWIDVSLANSGEANVFHHPEKRTITIRNEKAKDLERIWKTQQ
jgi:NTP pyrophosphatase (non-canonical NTP hydrolase)